MAVEFRGCRKLVFAEITKDDSTGYETGTVTALAPVAEISKSVETSSEAHYYDNAAAIVINSEGADTVSLTIAIPDAETYAKLTGRTYNSTKKALIETERETKYFALGYILGEVGEGELERYVWRYKGTFNIPDETSATKNDGTDANNMTLEYTGIYTEHEFAGAGGSNGRKAKAAYIYSDNTAFTETTWFQAVATPDIINPQ